MNGRFKYLKNRETCKVCGESGKGCRELEKSDGILYFCRGENPSPDYHFLNYDKSGVFSIYIDKKDKEVQDKESEEERKRRREEYIAQRKAKEERQAREYETGLPLKERNGQFRRLINQLSLDGHHKKDLERRGLSSEQIEKGMFRSVSAEGTKISTSISQFLPGAWDWGKSFKVAKDGYLCPIFNAEGLIIGAQVRADDSSNGNKYSWLKTKKSSHLQNGELPLTIHIAEGDRNLRLAEGVLKPYIAYCLRYQNYMGAAGGNFASSPEQFKEYIDKVNPEKIILTPDAGSRTNKHVVRQYQRIANLLKSWGIELWVESWGQSDNKDSCDVDEIDISTPTTIISFDEWNILAVDSETKKYDTKLISREEWWKKHGIIKEAQKLSKWLTNKFKGPSQGNNPKKHQHSLSETTSETTKSTLSTNNSVTAITLWEPPLKLGIPYITYTGPGSIPYQSDFLKSLENENWLNKDIEIKFDLRVHGDAPAKEAIAKGWNIILDKHDCGEGKSHVYGGLTVSKLKDIERTVFAASNHRNPTVESVEHRYDLIAKHSGLSYNPSKLTPLGNAYLEATPKDKIPDIAPPCVEHKLFIRARELQLNTHSGKSSPICQKCTFFSDCQYLERRKEALSSETIRDENGDDIGQIPIHPDLRADLNGLNIFQESVLLIIDEISKTYKATESIQITLEMIARIIMQLDSLENKKLSLVLERLCKKIYKVIESYQDNTPHGLNHEETLKLMPTKSEVEEIIDEVYSDEITKGNVDLWGKVEYIYKVERDSITRELNSVVTGEYETFSIPSIEDLISECNKKIKTNLDDIIDAGMTPGEKVIALQENYILDFLSPILKAINKYRKVNLSLSKNSLTITKPFYRHQNILDSAKVNIFLDATANVQDIRSQLRVPKDTPILSFSSLGKDYSNLNIKCMQDFGHASSQRRSGSQYTETERIKALIEGIANKHPDKKIGLIDRKAHAYNHKLPANIVQVGHWGNDSRGSNQFLECDIIIAIGDYTENLGALNAHWQCTTGQIISPTTFSGNYGEYLKRRRIADLEQVIGRLRAQNRPDEQLTIYLAGNWKDDELSVIKSKLSKVNLEKVATYDVCTSAAKKGQQTKRKFIEQIFLHLLRGENPLQESIAKTVGVSRSRLSQLSQSVTEGGYRQIKKMLVLLVEAMNKTNIPKNALLELPDEGKWLIQEWLPNFHEYVEKGENIEDVVQVLEVLIESFGENVLEHIPIDTLLGLIKLLLAPMPTTFWQSLRSSLDPIPI